MAEIRINLLKNRPTLSEAEYRRERKMLFAAIVGLILIVILSVSLSLWNLMLSRELASKEAKITAANKEIQGLVQANASQIYLKSRLKLITSYLGQRSVMRQALQQLLSNDVAGTHVTAVSYLEDNVIQAQVMAGSVVNLTELVKYYQTSSSYFTQVVSRGITRTREGNYQLSLELTLPKEVK